MRKIFWYGLQYMWHHPLRPLVFIRSFTYNITIITIGGAGGVENLKNVDNCKRKKHQ
jgi:hypothetical protein